MHTTPFIITLHSSLLFSLMLLLLPAGKTAEAQAVRPRQGELHRQRQPPLRRPPLPLAHPGPQPGKHATPKLAGRLHAPLTLSVTAPANNAVLRIVVDSSDLNYVTILQEILPARGETYTFTPAVKWKYDRLRLVRQHRPLDLTLTCYINDEETDIRNLHIDIRSVNECPLSFRYNPNPATATTTSSTRASSSPPTSTRSTPRYRKSSPTPSRRASSPASRATRPAPKPTCRSRSFAVWYYALSRGLSYSSISCTSNPSPTTNVQHIRFFDEVWNTRQANCIDACVFFASILRKIGLKPVIFVEPCHAYLGYYTDKNRRNIALLETTITSWVNFPDLLRNLDPEGYLPEEQLRKISKYLSPRTARGLQQPPHHHRPAPRPRLHLTLRQSLHLQPGDLPEQPPALRRPRRHHLPAARHRNPAPDRPAHQLTTPPPAPLRYPPKRYIIRHFLYRSYIVLIYFSYTSYICDIRSI